MPSLRPWVVPAALVVAFAAFALGSCGGGSTKGGPGAANLSCAVSSMTGSSCTEAQSKPYVDCVFAACDAQYQQCLGPGYQSGTFSGVCSTYMTCLSKCACKDTACSSACGFPDAACLECFQATTGCSSTCTAPACSGTGAGGERGGGFGGASGGGTCAAAVQTCCNAAGASKPACESAASPYVGLDEATCNAFLPAIKMAYCPASAGAGGGPGTTPDVSCRQLSACCAAASAANQELCMTVYAAASAQGESGCSAALLAYKTSFCP